VNFRVGLDEREGLTDEGDLGGGRGAVRNSVWGVRGGAGGHLGLTVGRRRDGRRDGSGTSLWGSKHFSWFMLFHLEIGC
jgi:hypothetical protein